MATSFQFPVYRKYSGLDTWFKIISPNEFIEIKKVGKRYVSHHVHARQFPEIQFITDMLACYEDRWQPADETEFVMLLMNITNS